MVPSVVPIIQEVSVATAGANLNLGNIDPENAVSDDIVVQPIFKMNSNRDGCLERDNVVLASTKHFSVSDQLRRDYLHELWVPWQSSWC